MIAMNISLLSKHEIHYLTLVVFLCQSICVMKHKIMTPNTNSEKETEKRKPYRLHCVKRIYSPKQSIKITYAIKMLCQLMDAGDV